MTYGRSEPIVAIESRGWTGGLNKEADPFQLEITESPDAINVDFENRGAVSKRRGYVKHSTSDPGGMAVGQHLFKWRNLGGAEWLVYVDADGDVFYTSGTTFAAPSTAPDFGVHTEPNEYPFSIAAMNNAMYLTTLRGSDAPQKFDGTTWTDMTVTNFDGTAARFPRARALVVAHERVFAFNVRSFAGSEYRSRMYWSNPAAPEKWDALDYIDIAPDDGQEITGALLFGEQIVIWKNGSMYLLSGTDAASFTLYPIDSALGTESPNTAVPVGAEVYFFDHRTGVWAFDGGGFNQVDEKINTYLLDGVNASAPEVAHAFHWRGRYFLSLPWGSSVTPNRTFVYDIKTKAWTEYDFGVSGFAVAGNLPLAVGVRDGVGVFRMFNGQTDNGANINAYMETSWFAPDSPSAKHRVRRLDLALTATGNHNLTVRMARDFSMDAYRTQVINTNPGGFIWGTSQWGVDDWGSGLEEILSRTSGWGDTWRVMQLRFSEAGSGDFQINRMALQISSRRRMRGEH